MKRSLFNKLKPVALAAVGVFLGRGASADTLLTFNARPPGQNNNAMIIDGFGSHATNSSAGVQVIGTGTPDIALTWQSDSGRWDYYIDSVWSAGQLDSSNVGVSHEVVFTPIPTVPVIVRSFNFHPYYVSNERYTYDWEVVNGVKALTNGNISFVADATKNHPVNINYTGAPGLELTLRLTRIDSTLTGNEIEGSGGNIAVGDINFAQAAEILPPIVTASSPGGGQAGVAPQIAFRAVGQDGGVPGAKHFDQTAV